MGSGLLTPLNPQWPLGPPTPTKKPGVPRGPNLATPQPLTPRGVLRPRSGPPKLLLDHLTSHHLPHKEVGWERSGSPDFKSSGGTAIQACYPLGRTHTGKSIEHLTVLGLKKTKRLLIALCNETVLDSYIRQTNPVVLPAGILPPWIDRPHCKPWPSTEQLLIAALKLITLGWTCKLDIRQPPISKLNTHDFKLTAVSVLQEWLFYLACV